MKKKTPRILTYLFPTFGNIIWLTTFFMVLRAGRRMMNGDGDLGFHITLGRHILDSGKIPSTDIFSHTMTGQPVIEHEWLAGVIFAAIDNLLGFNGVILLCALVIASSFLLVYKNLKKESKTLLIPILVTAITVATSMVHWVARPHIFTFLLFSLWMIVLEKLYQGRFMLWWVLPLIMLLWANLHGVFVIGILTWFIYGFGIAWDQFFSRTTNENPTLPTFFWRYYFLGGVTAFLASLINPYGFRLWRMIFSHVSSRFLTDNTQEFMSPNFHNVEFWPFLIYVGLLIAVLGLVKKKWNSGLLFNAALWLILGLYGARNVPLFGIASAPILSEGLDDLFSNVVEKSKIFSKIRQLDHRLQKTDRIVKGALWPILSVIIVFSGLQMGFRFDAEGLGYGFDPDIFPVEAVNWLENHPQDGDMFNTFDWGGYLQYRLWPDKLVFIDSKSHLYGEKFVQQYLKTLRIENDWEDIFDEYKISWAILPPETPVSDVIQEELNWETVYKDDTAIVLRKP